MALFSRRVLKDSADPANELSGIAKTATFNSEGFTPKLDRVGLVLDIGTVSGTSPTLDIKAQISLDGGTTWLDHFPDAVNSQTQATLTQITATTETSKYWDNPLGAAGAVASSTTNQAQMRFVFTIAGTSPSFTLTNVYVIEKSYN